MTDYIGAFMAAPKDIKHYGRKGMKWGQRIFTKGEGSVGSDKQARTEKMRQQGRSTAEIAKATGQSLSEVRTQAKRPPGNIQDNVESSSARYDRLAGQAKAGRAHEMTEQDLKFFNARTDALAKINKMNEEKPSWLRDTTTEVIQSTAKRQMQMVSNALADKYVGDPIKKSILGATAAANSKKKSSSDDDDDD